MEGTQNLQNQQPTALQQPRTDLQTGSSSLAPGVPSQQELVAPELRVGNTSIRAGATNTQTAPSPTEGHSLAPLLWLLLPVLAALVILWPSKKPQPVVENPVPEPVPTPAPQKRPKKKPTGKSTKRKKSKR